LEAQLKQSREELAVLTKSQKEWSSRSAQLLSKYNRVDPAEINKVKSELEATKTELDAIKASNAQLETTIVTLQANAAKFNEEKSDLVKRCNDRGRLAMDFKKKFAEANAKLNEAEKKLKAAEAASAVNIISLLSPLPLY
jgi:nucleoprotein TPR